MFVIKRIIHGITSRLPNFVHRKLASFYNGRAIVSLFNEFGVKEVLKEIFYRKYTGKSEYNRLRKKLDLVRKKDVITVVFQVWNISKWKSDSVYCSMKKHPRFNPVIWITDEPGASSEENINMRLKLKSYFDSSLYTIIEAENWDNLDKIVKPDIVFIQDHYPRYPINILSNILGRILCYVRYCYPNSLVGESHNYFFCNYSVFAFMENESIKNEQKHMMLVKDRNMVVTGHPMVDCFLSQKQAVSSVWKECGNKLKRIIWSPHWTINDDACFYSSTFLKYYQFMVDIARKYQDKIQIAFKPHPTLYRLLCEHPQWGQIRTDEYYALWDNMPNSQLETGAYVDLMMQSDAMIHDCGSFILEYLLVDKPCMFLNKGEGYPHFNHTNKEALKCYSLGFSEKDIELFIIENVLAEKDEKQEIRREFAKQYLLPPCGKTAAENIIDTILYA